MTSWYQIDIDESWLSAGRLHRLCRQFQRAYIRAGAPAEMALFALRDTCNTSRCLYVSPAARTHAADLLDAYAARPCSRPAIEHLTLLYGPPDVEHVLFRTEEPFGRLQPQL